jgi:iron-sulfur cluster repair protein YtfE (RIC family)
MLVYNVIDFEQMSVSEICEYLLDKYYFKLSSEFNVLRRYLDTCNLHEKDNDNTHGMIRILIDKLNKDCNLVVKNDTHILFPKIQHTQENIDVNTIDVFKKMHQSILITLAKIKTLFNNYRTEKYWNTYTQLAAIEMQNIEENIQNIIFIKEKYLWHKIENITI